MNNWKFALYLIFALCTLEQAAAQVVAPEFICIKEDTLFWNPAVNSCGPFNSVDVFKSSNRDGPYSLVASVSDPNKTLYVDPDPNISYYYLQSNLNCSGQIVTSSDTLNNQFQQLVTKIERVSVQGSDVLITWYDNGSAQTIGYIIYRITNQGTLPIDTVFSGLSYLDVTASPNEKVEFYYVLGINACGNTNTFDTTAHNTILLTTEVDFCRQHIKLTWNDYQLWDNGIENNQIWLGFDGAPQAFEHQIGGSDTLAYITGIIDDGEYCLSILAKENGRNVTSSSNTVCVISDVLVPLKQLVIRNASVNENNDVDIDWLFNANANLSALVMQRGNDSIAFANLSTGISPPTLDLNQYFDGMADVQSQPYFYRLSATDDCDSTQESNYVSTIHLRILGAQDGENQLAWTPFHLPGRIITGYEVCKVEPNGEVSLATTAPDQRFYTDDIAIDARGEIACYQVKAIHTEGSGLDLLESKSNLICVEQEVDLYIPNAFVPEGVNDRFVPTFLNAPDGEYQMTIFNRWGGKVFEARNFNDSWDGSQDGVASAAGVYFYIVQFRQPDGNQEMRSGTVTLIR